MQQLAYRWAKHKYLLLMALPGLCLLLVFQYLPLWGLLVAFKDFQSYRGFMASPWVGLSWFAEMFRDPVFWGVFRNSLLINLYNLVFYFPIPIVLALLLNEVLQPLFKRVIQTVLYLPHFLSWIIIYGITFLFFSNQGLVNTELRSWNLPPLQALLDPGLFRPMIVLQQIWRESGWGAIIILASLTTINPDLYEAAAMDGANRAQRVRHITLPSIKGIILILLILRLGNILRNGFEQIYVMQNPLNYAVSDVFETFSFRTGILNGNLSYATAVGLFQSVVALALVVATNWLVTRTGEEGIW